MKYNKAIDFYISHLLESHEVRISERYPDSIFWVKDGKIIAEIEEESRDFWLRIGIWKDISRMFELDYNGTQSVIKDWLELHYNLGELTPPNRIPIRSTMLELHYNLGELTPSWAVRRII